MHPARPTSLLRALGLLLALPAALLASSRPGETVFTFDTPADALALTETVSGAPMTIYVPAPSGGLGDSGSLQWRTGNRVAVRHANTLRVDGARPIRMSIAFLVFAGEGTGGQPLAIGVRATADAASEFGRNATAANAGFRLGLQADNEPGNYRLMLVNLPAGPGQQAIGRSQALKPGEWYRLEIESTPSGPHRVDLVGRLISLNAWGSPTGVIDEVTLRGAANGELLGNTQLVPWFGGQSGALRGIATVDNFSVANQ